MKQHRDFYTRTGLKTLSKSFIPFILIAQSVLAQNPPKGQQLEFRKALPAAPSAENPATPPNLASAAAPAAGGWPAAADKKQADVKPETPASGKRVEPVATETKKVENPEKPSAAEKKPAKEKAKPAQPTVVDKKPAEEKSKPAADKPAKPEAKPAQPAVADKKPAEEKSKPAADKPAKPEAKPAEPAVADKKPAEEKSKPAADKPAKPEVKPAQPAMADKKAEKAGAKPEGNPALQIRPAELPANTQSAKNLLGDDEKSIRQQLKSLSKEQIEEFAAAYSRLGNKSMATAMVLELFRRDPNDPTAEKLQKELTDNSRLSDDPEAIKAQEMLAAGNAAGAARTLENLKKSKYQGKPFRYMQDYAYALLQSGRESEAEAAFRELLVSSTAAPEEKADARASLRSMVIDSLLKKGQGAVTAKDARNAMTIAEQLLRGNANDPDGVALKAAALGMMGKPEEAIAYLEGLRSKSSPQRFLHLQALADAYQDAKQPEKAKQINEAILSLAASTAEDKKEARSRMLDLEWDSLLATGEKALAANKLEEASNALAQLETLKPKSVDLLWFRAAILAKEGRWQEAAATYEECKLRQGAAFDANSSLGEAYANSGNWQEATNELITAENDPRLDKITRFEAGRLSRIMKERIRPTLASRYEASDGQEGIAYRSSTELSSGIIGGNNIFYLRTNTDYLRLKESTVKRSREERSEAEVAYRRLLGNGYYGEVSAGAHQDGGMYGAKIGRYEGPGFAWDFSLNKNARATDSLPLEAINGRQDTIAFTVSTEFSRNFYMDARFFLRNVHVDGHDIGDGYGMQANVGYAVLNETTTRPEVSLNYFNEISRFNPRTLSNDFVSRYGSGNSDLSFIDEKINRHGVSITIAKHITPQMLAYFYGGVGYEFESAQAENRLGAGVDVQIGNNTSLNIGVDYTSSGNTGNRGDDVFSGTVSVKHSF